MLGDEGLLEVDDLVQSNVRMEGGLNSVEKHNRTVSASAAVNSSEIIQKT